MDFTGLLFSVIIRLPRSGEFIDLTNNEDVRGRKATLFVENVNRIK